MKVFIFIIVISIAIYLVYRKLTGPKKLKEEKIIERWSTLIEEANGGGEKVFAGMIQKIETVEAPDIFVSRKTIKPGVGYVKKNREFLVVEHRILDGYDMYVGARDYGKQLFVSWYLVEEPVTFLRLFKRSPIATIIKYPIILIRRIISIMYGGTDKLCSPLNLFDTEELTAYITTVHHALLDSVKSVMEDQKLDFTKIEKRTSGFLNIV